MIQRKAGLTAAVVALSGVLSVGSLFLGGAAGCGSSSGGGSTGGGSGDLASVTVEETKVGEGSDFNPAVSFFASGNGGLSFTVAGADVNGDGTVGSPTVSNITVESGDTIALTLNGSKRSTISNCGTTGISGTQVDIGISLDTTASMGAAAGILAERIANFAQALEDAGADARFAGITTGDAFATKADPSGFTDAISSGSLGVPPAFDFDERPDTGHDLLAADDLSTFFTEVRTVIGSGSGGGDLPENYLGPVKYLNDSVNWRSTASRVLISIGDDCSQTNSSAAGAGITDPWTPPSGATLIEALRGNTPVHVIGSTGLGCTDPFFEMKDLSDATGGLFVELGSCGSEESCNVDLSNLPITTSITDATRADCDFATDGDDLATVCMDIAADGGDANFCAVLALTRN